MNPSSLPKYSPALNPDLATGAPRNARGLSARTSRAVVEFGFVLVFLIVLYQLRQFTTAAEIPPPAPVEFKLIQERYNERIPLFITRESAFQLFGPPTEWPAWEPDFEAVTNDVAVHRTDPELPDDRL